MQRGVLCTGLLILGAVHPAVPQDRARVPVLVELFTSEGCSDCPPADVLLERLDRAQPVPAAEIIVLSEHVDYWNSLGWKDPFSSHDLSARQEAYGRRFGLDGVYTPQMVVDGGAEFVGADSRRALSAIEAAARAGKVPIRISRFQPPVSSGTGVRVEIDSVRHSGDVYLVVADSLARSQVLRGENRGRSLQHVAVVRRMEQLGKWNGRAPFTKEIVVPQVITNTARVVAFMQESGTGHVLGAAMLRSSQ